MVAGVNEERRKKEFSCVASPSHTHKTHARTHACMRGEERKRKERKREERKEKITRGGRERAAPEVVHGEGDRREAGNVHGRGREC